MIGHLKVFNLSEKSLPGISLALSCSKMIFFLAYFDNYLMLCFNSLVCYRSKEDTLNLFLVFFC